MLPKARVICTVRHIQDAGHLPCGVGLHLDDKISSYLYLYLYGKPDLFEQRLEVHALGLPELDLRHRTRVLVLLRVQQVGRVLAQDLEGNNITAEFDQD